MDKNALEVFQLFYQEYTNNTHTNKSPGNLTKTL